METNAITIRDVIDSYEKLKLSTELKYDTEKYQNGLVQIFANHGEKIDFRSSDYEKNWPKLKTNYRQYIIKWNQDKKKKNSDKFRNFSNVDDVFYSAALYPTLCFKTSSR